MDIFEYYNKNKFVTLGELYDKDGNELNSDLFEFIRAFSTKDTSVRFYISPYELIKQIKKYKKTINKYDSIDNKDIDKKNVREYLNTGGFFYIPLSSNKKILRFYSKFEKLKDILTEVQFFYPRRDIKFREIKYIKLNTLKKFAIDCSVIDMVKYRNRFIDLIDDWDTLNDEDIISIYESNIKTKWCMEGITER